MKFKSVYFLIFTLLLFLIDRFTKFFALNFLAEHSYNFFLIQFILVKNLGGAWGILSGQTYFLIFAGAVFLISCIVLWFKIPKLRASLSFLIAGVSSNLLDRIFGTHQVIDFINIHILPVFNLSDVYIDIGALLLIYYYFTEMK